MASPPTDADWGWVTAYGPIRFEMMATLTFARGATPDMVAEAYDLDPSITVETTAIEGEAHYEGPGRLDDLVRVAPLENGWLAAIEPNGLYAHVDHGAKRLAARCPEVLSFSVEKMSTLTNFDYYRDAVWLTSGALDEGRLVGPQPHLFDAAFRAAGVDPWTVGDLSIEERFVIPLRVLSVQLGFYLPADVYLGPLLTFTTRLPTSPPT